MNVAPKEEWESSLLIGDNMQVRTRNGRRAAVMRLEPDLYLVKEIPAPDNEFGLAAIAVPLLTQMMVQSARRSLFGPREGKHEGSSQAPFRLPWRKDREQ